MSVPVQGVCSLCGGTKWKVIERDGISAAERCECASAGRQSYIEARADIPPLYQNASVDNFRTPQDNPQAALALKSALLTVKTYVREYPNTPKPGLMFIGPPGTGKTHLAVAALQGLIDRGFEGVFFDFLNLLDRIHKGYDAASGTMEKEAFRTALDTDIVVIDDLGAHRVIDWVEDTVTAIITHRCNNRKATIITTNLREPEAGDSREAQSLSPIEAKIREAIESKRLLEERIGMRARSRLFEMCKLVKMPYVEDFRLGRR